MLPFGHYLYRYLLFIILFKLLCLSASDNSIFQHTFSVHTSCSATLLEARNAQLNKTRLRLYKTNLPHDKYKQQKQQKSSNDGQQNDPPWNSCLHIIGSQYQFTTDLDTRQLISLHRRRCLQAWARALSPQMSLSPQRETYWSRIKDVNCAKFSNFDRFCS